MNVFNIHYAKTHLSRLIDRAAKGESFIIAKAGKPIVKVVPVDQPTTAKRLGFMAGEFTVPTEFNHIQQEEIEQLFSADE